MLRGFNKNLHRQGGSNALLLSERYSLPFNHCTFFSCCVGNRSRAGSRMALRVGHDLLELYDGGPTQQANVAQSDSGAASVFQRKSQARFDTKGRVQIDAHFNCTNGAPTAALKAAGLLIGTTVTKAPFCVVEGWISPSALPNLASVPGVKLVVIPKYAVHTHPSAGKPTSMMQPLSQAHTQFAPQAQAVSTPAIDGEAITIMREDQFIAIETSVNCTGVSVAVMSGDVSSLSVIQARGELPNTVEVIQPSVSYTRPFSNR